MRRLFFHSSDPRDAPPSGLVQGVNFAAAFLLISAIFYFSFQQVTYHWNWPAVLNYRQKFIHGWLVTIGISLVSLVLSTAIGLFFALAQRSPLLLLRYFSRIYVEGVRGTPLLVQILIFFYVVAQAFHVTDRYLVGILTLSFFSGAYISEMIRAGIESVGKSQLESARAIGLTNPQIYRYVILPQALRQTLPPLAGQLVSLIKDSSLLSIIAISEFTLNAQEVNAYTYSAFESYIPLAIGYLLLTLPVSMGARWLEKRFRYET